MDFLKQMTIIFAVSLAGSGISKLLPFAFPGSVISMILLFILLAAGVIKLHHVEKAGKFLTENMALLFVPTVVGVSEHFPLILKNLAPLIAVIVITTVLTFAVTAATVTGVIRLQQRIKERKR